MRELRQILEGYAPIVTTGDKPVWTQDMGGKFTIKATYCHFINRGMLVSNTNWVWKTNCPPKVRMFLWLLSKRALLTWPQLQRRQIVPNICVLCKEQGETSDHIIFKYTFSNPIWHICAWTFGLNINIILNNNLWSKLEKGYPRTQMARTMTTVFYQNIWKERNSRIFNSTAHLLHYCMRHIIHDIIIWTCIPSEEERLQLSDDLQSIHQSSGQHGWCEPRKIGHPAGTSRMEFTFIAIIQGVVLFVFSVSFCVTLYLVASVVTIIWTTFVQWP